MDLPFLHILIQDLVFAGIEVLVTLVDCSIQD